MKRIITICSALILACIGLTGCGTNQSNHSAAKAENASLKAENSSLKKSESTKSTSIVGSYKDDQAGAAVTLNSDGTGRYVYADPTNSNTDDQLTWKKNSDNSYTINLKDSNVTSPLTGKLTGKKLTLSGDSNWNTETLSKTSRTLDLDKFLAENTKQSSQGASQAASNASTQKSNAGTNDNSSDHPRLSDGTDVYSLPLSDPRNPDGYKQGELMDIAGDPKYRNPDGSMNDEGRALSSSIEATFHQPE